MRNSDLVVNLDSGTVFKRPCVLAVGIFDGMHIGHMRVVKNARRLAEKFGAIPCVLTFSPHPSHVIPMHKGSVKMIYDGLLRAETFRRSGVSLVFVKRFDRRFAAMSPESFAKMLRRVFPNLRGIVTGFNFVFGRGAEGDVSTLRELSEKFGWAYISVGGIFRNGERVSSTRLRNALSAGDMATYAKLAGCPYMAFGNIVGGRKIGRKIGFPTLNLPWAPECKPPYGVYAVVLERGNRLYKGVANYGVSPTFGKTEPSIETNLFEPVCFGKGSKVKVSLLKFLRPEERFESVEELKERISKDKEAARAFFARRKKMWGPLPQRL